MFCPKCGNSLPDNATFCNGCGAQLGRPQASPANQAKTAVRPATAPAKAVASASSALPGIDVLVAARAALGAVTLILCFLPWATYTYTGAITGMSSESYNLFFFKGWMPVVIVLAALAMIAGAAMQHLMKKDAGKWVSLIGSAIVLFLAIALGLAFSDGSGSFDVFVASGGLTATPVPWICALAGVAGAASCFIKR